MGTMNISFADVESGGFEPIPEGTYDAIIDKVEVRESKSSDHNYLNFEMVIQDEDYEGRRMWMINSFSPKALFRMKDTLEALGQDVEDVEFEWDDDVEVTTSGGPLLIQPDLDGLPCRVVVTTEVYEGKERNRVNEIRPASGSGSSTKKAGKAKGKAKDTKKAAKKPARRAVR